MILYFVNPEKRQERQEVRNERIVSFLHKDLEEQEYELYGKDHLVQDQEKDETLKQVWQN